jgi:hypothetical protein
MSSVPWDMLPGQSLAALLALVGTKGMDVEALRSRTKLAPLAFAGLLKGLQQEYLVDIVSSLDGDHIGEKVELTDRGESVLVSTLEMTCELPEPL